MGLFHSHSNYELEQIKFRLAQLENDRPIPEVIVEPPAYSPRRSSPSLPSSQKVPTWHGELMAKIKIRRHKINREDEVNST